MRGRRVAGVGGALSAPSLESWSRQVGLVEMCHNTTHRGQQASASGDYLLYTLFPPSHHQSCSVMHFNERRVVFQAHMKGLLTLQYPLLLSACAIEYDLFPPLRGQKRTFDRSLHPVARPTGLVSAFTIIIWHPPPWALRAGRVASSARALAAARRPRADATTRAGRAHGSRTGARDAPSPSS